MQRHLGEIDSRRKLAFIQQQSSCIMTLNPLLDAPLAVQIHVLTVIPAALLGALLLLRPKGTPLHRMLGKVWLLLMLVTALSTFFIHEIRLLGPFSPIHALSVYVLIGVWQAIAAARRRDIRAHRRHVTCMYFGGIVVAGLFTLLPGRLMHEATFSGLSSASSLFAVGVAALAFISAGLLAIRESGLWRASKKGSAV